TRRTRVFPFLCGSGYGGVNPGIKSELFKVVIYITVLLIVRHCEERKRRDVATHSSVSPSLRGA
ncbi:MAG: hypothetical protein LBJ43_06855, partial [Propionibacteriaceae bacterium]|nr:hypothetical protein [Propionibacteriaceae bacterium]